jgi:hypothetical protein
MTLENLVLGGIRVSSGVKTMLVREGSKQGHVQTSASLSHPRVADGDSPSWPMTDYQAESRRDLFDEEAAIRAGRSVSFAGVPVCPAVQVGRAIPKRWPLVEGGPCSTAVRRFGGLAKTRASEANELPAYCVRGSVLARFSRIGAEGGMKHSPLSKQAPKHGKARLGRRGDPTDAMPSTSTRGA